MIPIIPDQRKFPIGRTKVFNKLVAYIEENRHLDKLPPVLQQNDFNNLLDYATTEIEDVTNIEKCIAIRGVNIVDLSSAAKEMNSIALQNTRCTDPVFHFILSWHDFENPKHEEIFDAALHALNRLGLSDHQALIAVHVNTDNTHCHVAVNKINPYTFKSKHLEWTEKTLHFAARESEIKHGWVNDNGLYIAKEQDGKMTIIPNPDLATEGRTLAHLPAWSDPLSLESWLKTEVSKPLKYAIKDMRDWDALHTWLSRYSLTLKFTGGGLKLVADSSSGEILEIAASKGLRPIKHGDLEKLWGKFYPRRERLVDGVNTLPDAFNADDDQRLPCVKADYAKTDLSTLQEKLSHELDRFDFNINPKANISNILGPQLDPGETEAKGRSGLYELPRRGVDGLRQTTSMLLPGTVSNGLGNYEGWYDSSVRHTFAASGEAGRLGRDPHLREVRRIARAEARLDLRNRYSSYCLHVDSARNLINRKISLLRKDSQAVINNINISTSAKLQDKSFSSSSIDSSAVAYKANIQQEANYYKMLERNNLATSIAALRLTQTPPLSWREWLFEQSGQGDQAAISALRGIVYDEKRDLKKQAVDMFEADGFDELDDDAKHKKLLSLLLIQEQNERAIRAAKYHMLRPYQIDSTIARYRDITFTVTNNGLVTFSHPHGGHIFTDRGNRITFDKVYVSDEDIQLALLHSKEKFGGKIFLTGSDVDFSRRVAVIADSIGMSVLNPELQSFVLQHKLNMATTIAPREVSLLPILINESSPSKSVEEELRLYAMSLDPQATIVEANFLENYKGKIVKSILDEDGTQVVLQHTERSIYVIHKSIPADTSFAANDVATFSYDKNNNIEINPSRSLNDSKER